MTNDELLLAISNMIDVKFEAFERSFNAKIDAVEARLNAKIDAVEARLNARIDALDAKIDAVNENLSVKINNINLLLENDVVPRMNEIESCYLSTFDRYKQNNEKFEAMQLDIRVIKDVVLEHAERLSMYQSKLVMA